LFAKSKAVNLTLEDIKEFEQQFLVMAQELRKEEGEEKDE